MTDITREIWMGLCSCEEHIVRLGNLTAKSLSAVCKKCKALVELNKVSYTGPQLTPMVPNEHHIWCNGQQGNVRGCRWCCYQNLDGGWDGLWLSYPYDPALGMSCETGLMEKYFPNVIRRT